MIRRGVILRVRVSRPGPRPGRRRTASIRWEPLAQLLHWPARANGGGSAIGKLVSSGATGSTGWSYDAAGHVTWEQNMQRNLVYDAETRQTTASITGPERPPISFTTVAASGSNYRICACGGFQVFNPDADMSSMKRDVSRWIHSPTAPATYSHVRYILSRYDFITNTG
jgi:hypothetical protein